MKRFYAFTVILLLANCARIGAPTGGKKDTTPPVLLKSIPANQSVNFNHNEIILFFDEFITLKDIQKNLLISPPLNKKPKISPLGIATKTLHIIFDNDLQPNTTYLIDFGESIADYNENNKLKHLQLVFSTGKTIDSLSLKGSIFPQHYEKKPENIMLGLYPAKSFKDSSVYKAKPFYVTIAQKNNTFQFTHLKKGKYKLIAIDDVNQNYLYKPKKESIGFVSDTIDIPNDTIVNINIFKEKIPTKIDEINQKSANHIEIKLAGDGHDISILPKQKEIEYININSPDKINVWYKTRSDSIKFVFKSLKQKKKFFKKRLEKTDSLVVNIVKKGTVHPKDSIRIKANIPLSRFSKDKILLYKNDSLPITCNLSKNKNHTFDLSFTKDYGTRYKVLLLPHSITDFLGNKNKDTIQAKITVPAKESFGNLYLELDNLNNRYVFVELLNEQNKILQKTATQNKKDIIIKDLSAGKYKIRIIFDNNKNNLWNTGNYLLHKKPEQTLEVNKTIEIRANWDIHQKILLP